MNAKFHCWRRRVRTIAGLLAVATFFSGSAVMWYFIVTAPRAPVVMTGQIFSDQLNGTIVYLTQRQQWLMNHFFPYAFFGLLALAGLLSLPDVRVDATGQRKF